MDTTPVGNRQAHPSQDYGITLDIGSNGLDPKSCLHRNPTMCGRKITNTRSPALCKLCRELQAQSGIKLIFTCGDVPDSLAKNVSVSLFRVAQEALANVVKHSGAAAASIDLNKSRSHIRLRVVDYGHGFEQTSTHRHGLGLLSMRERVRLIGGELTVRSQPSQGTIVQAEIPLPG